MSKRNGRKHIKSGEARSKKTPSIYKYLKGLSKRKRVQRVVKRQMRLAKKNRLKKGKS